MAENQEELRRALAFALEKYPHQVELAPIEQLLLDAAREGNKRPAYLKIAVPDQTVKSLRGRKPSTDHLILVRLPREMTDRAASPIILPNEVG
jgi:hypothetical protein